MEECYLHILDPGSNTLVESTKLASMDEATQKEISTKIEKAMKSSSRKHAIAPADSELRYLMLQLEAKAMSLQDVSQKLATAIFNKKMEAGLFDPSDLIIASIIYDERRYVILLDNAYKQGLTHDIRMEDGECVNDIITHRAIYSANIMKNDRIVMIEQSDCDVHVIESKVEIEAEKVAFYSDLVFHLESETSYKESVAALQKTSAKIAEKYDVEKLDVMPKMKQMICDAAEKEEPLKVEEVADVLFHDKPLAHREFVDEVKQSGVKEAIHVERAQPSRSEKVQKIKTDKGIEVIIPIDFVNSEYVQFQNNADGTITIRLQNIAHISSR